MSACPACRAVPPEGSRFCPACGTSLAAPKGSAAERKVVTTLFADLVGYTALGERCDPEDVDRALRAFYDAARNVIERFGGTVEKYIGDAVVGAFGVPTAHEDDAERGVRAGLAIVGAMDELPLLGDVRLRVRVGVNTGLALVRLRVAPASGEGFLVGDPVNTAARLLAGAPEMGVVVGGTTRRLTARAIAYDELPPCAVKGKALPVKRWVACGAIARRGIDAIRRDETPMVGREVELALLTGLLDRAVASHSPQYALITGEAGIGKSRLVRELFRTVDERPGFLGTWRQGHCPAYGEELAYWAVGEIVSAHTGVLQGDSPELIEAKLAASLPESDLRDWLLERLRPLVGLPTAQTEREENCAAWTAFVEQVARTRPTVLVIEDVHWASDTTLAFLKHLIDHAADVPLLVIATARTEFLEAHPGADGYGASVRHIHLEALTGAESARLVRAITQSTEVPGLEQLALAHCGGNPLYAEELVRFAVERAEATGGAPQPCQAEVPDSLRAIIGARLDALPSGHKAVLADAAVIGQVFWPGPLAAINGADAESLGLTLERLCQRQLVRRLSETELVGEYQLTFSHALIRDVAYDQLPRTDRARKHAAVAEWLAPQEARGGLNVAEIIAYHYGTSLDLASAAHEDDLAARLVHPTTRAHVHAGDEALALDLHAAEEHYARALTVAPVDDPSRPRIAASRALAQAQGGRLHAAITAFMDAIEGLRSIGDRRAAAVAMTELSRVLVELSDPRAVEYSEAALATLADDGASPELVRVLEQRAYLYLTEGDSQSAMAAAERALSVARELGLPKPARALMQRGVAGCDSGDTARCLCDLKQALALALANGAAAEVSAAHACLAEAVLAFEGPAEALTILRDGLAIARSRHDEIGEGFLLGAEFDDLVLLGRCVEALDSCEGLEHWFHTRQQTFNLWSLRCTKAIALALRGGTSLEGAVRELARIESNPAREGARRQLLAVAVVRQATGETDAAARALERLACPAALGDEPALVIWWPLLWRTTLRANPGLVASMLEAQPAAIDRLPHTSATIGALLAEQHGDSDAAAAAFAHAAERWRALQVPLEEGEALFGLGRCRAAAGRPSDAAASFREAYRLFARLDAGPAMAEVSSALRALSSDGGSARLR